MIDYAAAGDLLAAYGLAWTTFDGDAWVALFSEDVEYHDDPFGQPRIGHNALRAYLLDAAQTRQDMDFTVERHWASDATVLAAWHVSYRRRTDRRLVRVAGFMTLEIDPEGRISRFREWARYAPGSGE